MRGPSKGVLLNGLKQGSIAVKAVGPAPHDRRQIIAKSVNARCVHPMAHGCQNELHDRRAICIKRIAATRVIHQHAIRMPVIERVIKTPQRNGWPAQIAFARVVEHYIKDNAQPRLMQRRNGFAYLLSIRPAQAVGPAQRN